MNPTIIPNKLENRIYDITRFELEHYKYRDRVFSPTGDITVAGVGLARIITNAIKKEIESWLSTGKERSRTSH